MTVIVVMWICCEAVRNKRQVEEGNRYGPRSVPWR